jgi:hypothetical protein
MGGDWDFMEVPEWVVVLCGSRPYRARAVVVLDAAVVRGQAVSWMEEAIREGVLAMPGFLPTPDDLW